jgi:hypothetical protein
MPLKPIKLYGGGQTPNPIKVKSQSPGCALIPENPAALLFEPSMSDHLLFQVAIILEELNLPYTVTGPQDWKSPTYLAINFNGKAPSIQDPNTDITVFEVQPTPCFSWSGDATKASSHAPSSSI